MQVHTVKLVRLAIGLDYPSTSADHASRREASEKANGKTYKKGCEIQQMLNRMNDEHAAAPRSRANPKRCPDCGMKFTEDYLSDGECPNCAYVACESCICDNNNSTVSPRSPVRKLWRAQFDDRVVLLLEFQFRPQVLPDGAALLGHARQWQGVWRRPLP